MIRLLLVGALLAAPACASMRVWGLAAPRCADGLPALILQHPSCRDGICGYSCEPSRWQDVLSQPPT